MQNKKPKTTPCFPARPQTQGQFIHTQDTVRYFEKPDLHRKNSLLRKILYYGELYPGQHDPIIDEATFQEVQAAFKDAFSPKTDYGKALYQALY